MAMCKHDMEGGCADCATTSPAVSPRPEYQPDLGPWIEAQWGGDCADCGSYTPAGEQIRADGEGGWLCGTCGHEGEVPAAKFRIPEYQVPVRPGGPSLAAFLDQHRQ